MKSSREGYAGEEGNGDGELREEKRRIRRRNARAGSYSKLAKGIRLPAVRNEASAEARERLLSDTARLLMGMLLLLFSTICGFGKNWYSLEIYLSPGYSNILVSSLLTSLGLLSFSTE